MLSLNETVKRHRKMWNWIASETSKRKKCLEKKDYLKEHGLSPYSLLLDCYCCEYDACKQSIRNCENSGSMYDPCVFCPLEWPDTGSGELAVCSTKDGNGLYDKWMLAVNSSDWETAVYYAKRIATLSEKSLDYRQGFNMD